MKVPLDDRQLIALENVNLIRDRFKDVVKNAIDRLQNYYFEQHQDLDEMELQAKKEVSLEKDLQLKAQKNPNIYSEMAKELNFGDTSQKEDLFSGTIYDDQSTAEDIKLKHEQKFQALQNYLDSVRDFKERKAQSLQ